jgi:hypothetical protein
VKKAVGLGFSHYIVTMSFCAPIRENKSKYTCFDDDALVRIATEYNREHNDKIVVPSRLTEESRMALWKEIKLRLQRIAPCPQEFCWIDVDFVRRLKLEDRFRPSMPEEWTKDMNTWLNNFDIEGVLNQYETMTADFEFIGPVPIDFDSKIGSLGQCVSDALCQLSVEKLWRNGKRKLGVVFNLDPHYKGGSHWVAMYCDLSAGTIYFFDSYGVEPPQQVIVLMNRIKEQGDKLVGGLIRTRIASRLPKNPNYREISKEGPFRIYYNKRQFQFGNSECGPFSMNFIVDLLTGKSFTQFVSRPLTDMTAMNSRLRFFRPPSSVQN